MNVQSIIQPKRPKLSGWKLIDGCVLPGPLGELGFPVEAWENPAIGLFVMSAVEVTNDPDDVQGPQYHLSVSAYGKRCNRQDAQVALRAFGLEDAKEDNHVPGGKVRNFWRQVADNLSGMECKCVDDEPAIREDKGDYIWRGVTP